jgi:hypothetical protein
MITNIELVKRLNVPDNATWLCITFGYWEKWGVRNWGLGVGRWKWLAIWRASRDWNHSIQERQLYLASITKKPIYS